MAACRRRRRRLGDRHRHAQRKQISDPGTFHAFFHTQTLPGAGADKRRPGRPPDVPIVERLLKRPVPGAALVVLVSIGLAPAGAQAQSSRDQADEAQIHLGPLGLTPRFAIRNLGVDTNVFNSAERPTKDFTMSLGPGVDTWLHIGRSLLSTQTLVEWTYFQKSAGQRSFNTSQTGRLEFDLTSVTPFVAGGVVNTRQRPNLEIDQRVRQNRVNAALGTRVELGGRSRIDVDMRREQIDFGDDQPGDALVRTALNREVTEGGIAFRMDVTPLTTFVVRTGVAYDTFEFSRMRDSDSVTVLPGLEMKPSALISGKAAVGYRKFNAKSTIVPDFSGIVAAVDVGYVIREATRFGVRVDRNLDYSLQVDSPYFVVTTTNVDVKQALGYSWDIVGRAGRAALAYQGLLADGGGEPVTRQRDRLTTYGVGVGRRLGEHIRVGFDVDHNQRHSETAFRGYEGFKFGGSFTYGS
jgi:hypothetical protein